jgi:integrase
MSPHDAELSNERATDDLGERMGHSYRRVGEDGKFRYTAIFRDIRGKRRSAGTYASRKAADRAWQAAEASVAEGRSGDPARGRQTFRRYVEVEWLPHHVMEPTTREGYTYSIYAHIMETFGPMRMREIMPHQVRKWVTKLQAGGMSPSTIRLNKTILSAIFTTALNDQVTFLHPCKGVRTPTVPRKPLRIITPDEFDTFYLHLPDDTSRLVVETDIETGMRWGELAELRPRDIDFGSRIVTVSRTVVELNPKYHPTGGRFLVKEYPKDKEWRRFRMSGQITTKIKAFVDGAGLRQDDLIFTYQPPERAPRPSIAAGSDLGMTEPNNAGRRYRHGTLSAYSAGRCRCSHCRRAYADYRAHRRAAGKDRPAEGRAWETDGHIPRRWFRDTVLRPALATSGLEVDIRMQLLRHAHASWLLAGGADLQVVRDRLGHGSISTTERYLHTLPDADDTAVDAFIRIRRRAAS